MKKYAALLAIMALCLTACGEKQEPELSEPPTNAVETATTTEPTTEKTTFGVYNAMDIMLYLKDNGAPNLGEIKERTETDDELLGRPNQYTSKASFTVTTITDKDPNSVWYDYYDGCIEVFETEEDLQKRYDSVKELLDSSPLIPQNYLYVNKNVLFRASYDVLPSEEKVYEELIAKFLGE